MPVASDGLGSIPGLGWNLSVRLLHALPMYAWISSVCFPPTVSWHVRLGVTPHFLAFRKRNILRGYAKKGNMLRRVSEMELSMEL